MKHTGGCHCGRVRFEVEMNLETGLSCNCSVCLKRGSLLAFAPRSALTVLSGMDELQTYQFNKKVIDHMFCKTCGILPFGLGVAPDGSRVVAVNVRCLDGVELGTLKVVEYDGRAK